MFTDIDVARLPKSKHDLDMVDKSEGVEEGEMEAWDDVKGRPLNPRMVQEARDQEMGYVKDHQVYKHSTIKECYDRTGAAPIETG